MVVAELLRWRVPLALIMSCVLLGFNEKLLQREDLEFLFLACLVLGDAYKPPEDNDYVELFAGAGEVSAKLRQEGVCLLQVKLGLAISSECFQDGAGGATMDIMDKPLTFDLTSHCGFALALNEVRRMKRGGCLIVAICCESFSIMCPGHTSSG